MSQLTPSGQDHISRAVEQSLNRSATPHANSARYTAEISRANPTAFVFLIDQSGSMEQDTLVNGHTVSKAEAATLAVNKLLNELIRRCTTEKGVILDRIFVTVIGYGQSNEEANIAWEGELEGHGWVPLSLLHQHPLDVMEEPMPIEEGTFDDEQKDNPLAGETIQVRSWFYPRSNGLTPMRSALEMAAQMLDEWIKEHPHCYPPIAFNLTDGEATDGEEHELLQAAHAIKDLASSNGNVLLFNCHISDESEEQVFFPAHERELPSSKNAKLLFNMSSDLPESYSRTVFKLKRSKGENVRDLNETYSAMIFNGGISEFVQMLDIGTRPPQSSKP